MHKAKPLLDKDSQLRLYFLHIHSPEIKATWPGDVYLHGTHKMNLQEIRCQQKYALRIVYNEVRYYNTK